MRRLFNKLLSILSKVLWWRKPSKHPLPPDFVAEAPVQCEYTGPVDLSISILSSNEWKPYTSLNQRNCCTRVKGE